MSGTDSPAPGRRRRILTVIGGGAAAAALIMGGTFVALAAAGAQTDPGAGPAPADTREAIREKAEALRRDGLGPAPGGRGHFGPFLRGPRGMPLHGEFTTKKPGGGFQTHATQLGEVTAVSSSSITVKSEDGFTRAYAVDGDTKVRPATDEGIGGIAKGETVHVRALVENGKARAVAVIDTAAVKELRGQRREGRAGKLRMEQEDQPAA